MKRVILKLESEVRMLELNLPIWRKMADAPGYQKKITDGEQFLEEAYEAIALLKAHNNGL